MSNVLKKPWHAVVFSPKLVLEKLDLLLFAGTFLLALAGFIKYLPITLRLPDMIDFGAYYFGAYAINNNIPLYERATMDPMQAQGVQRMRYVYPPVFAVLLRPLAMIPYIPAKLVWFLLSIALIVASVALLSQIFGFSKRKAALLSALVFLLPDVYTTLFFGQINAVLLILLTGMCVFSAVPPVSRLAQIASGVCLGTLGAFKLYPLAMGAVYLPRFRFLPLISAGVWLCIMFGIGIIAGGGIDNTLGWLSRGLTFSYSQRDYLHNQSLQAAMFNMFSIPAPVEIEVLGKGNYYMIHYQPLINAPHFGRFMGYALIGGILAVSAAALLPGLKRNPTLDIFFLQFSMLLTVMLLVTPVVWTHYYTLLLIPLLYIIYIYRNLSFAVRLSLQTILLIYVLIRYIPVMSLVIQISSLWSIGCFATIALWVVLVRLLLKAYRLQPSAAHAPGFQPQL